MTRMRIARTWFVVIAVSLAAAWGSYLLTLLPFFSQDRADTGADWLDIGYMFTFAIGHLLAFCASVVTAVYGISALIRSAEARRTVNYGITATAVLIGAFLSFILLHLNNLS